MAACTDWFSYYRADRSSDSWVPSRLFTPSTKNSLRSPMVITTMLARSARPSLVVEEATFFWSMGPRELPTFFNNDSLHSTTLKRSDDPRIHPGQLLLFHPFQVPSCPADAVLAIGQERAMMLSSPSARKGLRPRQGYTSTVCPTFVASNAEDALVALYQEKSTPRRIGQVTFSSTPRFLLVGLMASIR